MGVTITLYVDMFQNRVIMAEAPFEFADILLSFLTLPLGTVISTVLDQNDQQYPSEAPCSSLITLLNTVGGYLRNDTCRTMLLQPRSSSEQQCLELPLNVEGERARLYYACSQPDCSYNLISPYKNVSEKCHCGNSMSRVVSSKTDGRNDTRTVFFIGADAGHIMISDDFVIQAPSSVNSFLSFSQRIGLTSNCHLEEKKVVLEVADVRRLLSHLFTGKGNLTSMFLTSKCNEQCSKIKLETSVIGNRYLSVDPLRSDMKNQALRRQGSQQGVVCRMQGGLCGHTPQLLYFPY